MLAPTVASRWRGRGGGLGVARVDARADRGEPLAGTAVDLRWALNALDPRDLAELHLAAAGSRYRQVGDGCDVGAGRLVEQHAHVDLLAVGAAELRRHAAGV